MLPSAAAATSDSSGMKSGPLRMASTSSASSGRPKASRCRSWIWSRSSGCSGRMDQTGAATSSNFVVVMRCASSRLRAIRPCPSHSPSISPVSDHRSPRPPSASRPAKEKDAARSGVGDDGRAGAAGWTFGRRLELDSVARRVGKQPQVVKVGHVQCLAAEDERGAVDPRQSVEVARRWEAAGDLRPRAVGKRPEIARARGSRSSGLRTAPARRHRSTSIHAGIARPDEGPPESHPPRRRPRSRTPECPRTARRRT